MIAITLAELAIAMRAVLEPGSDSTPETLITGSVQVDSRLVEPGAIFFAMPGETTDGHLFAESAVEAGARVLVVQRRLELDVAQLIVPDVLAALAALAAVVVARVREAGALRVIGITGSNGKTTTKNMLRRVLETQGNTVAPQGSFNNHVGAPLSMLGIDEDTRFLVVEFGASAVGDIAELVAIAQPDISVVLKVGLAHAGGFGGIEATQRAKAELVTGLPPSAVAVLNADDERVAAMAELTKARTSWFGLSDHASVRADDIETTAHGTGFTLITDQGSRRVDLRILGEHHVMNALAAIAVSRELGIATDVAVAALEEMPVAERWRMQRLEAPGDVLVINDAYNASPDSVAAALKTLAQITRGRHRAVAVLGEMAELGEYADEEHDRIGRLVVRLNIDKLVVVGHAARHIHNAAGLEGSWNGESVLVDTPGQAYDLLRDELRAGDVVLVKSSKSAGLRHLGDKLGGVA